MNELVKEWVDKAEGDYHSALREFRARKHPNYDATGFHAQQSIEKYLKAILQRNNIRFEKVHDLLALMKLCLPLAPELELQKELLSYLNPLLWFFVIQENRLLVKKPIRLYRLRKHSDLF